MTAKTMADEAIYWIALSSIKDIGPVRMRNLTKAFGSPSEVFSASVSELRGVECIGEKSVRAINGFHDWKRTEDIVRRCAELDIRIIMYDSHDYPPSIKDIDDPPFVLYVRGDIKEDDRFALAVVGPRDPSEYGRVVADTLTGDLSLAGFTIVSGLARGIDTVSHIAALKRDGRTFAVMGSGIDIPYPPENAGLMRRIEKCGCVISEYPPGTRPDRENFPKRNRLISGLSLGVLVIEATNDSGALITARCALEQNREVFAVPGMITSNRSSGTNTLIKSGAQLVERASDIIGILAPQLKGFLMQRKTTNLEAVSLTDEERRVTGVLSLEPLHIDTISRQLSMSPQMLLGILTSLELKGVVRQIEGKKFFLS